MYYSFYNIHVIFLLFFYFFNFILFVFSFFNEFVFLGWHLSPFSGWVVGGREEGYQIFPCFLLLQTDDLAQKTFWPLVLTLFPRWCKIWRSYLVPVPNYWIWTKTTPLKKWFFWSNPYKTEVNITSPIEMLELLNFGHITTSKI